MVILRDGMAIFCTALAIFSDDAAMFEAGANDTPVLAQGWVGFFCTGNEGPSPLMASDGN